MTIIYVASEKEKVRRVACDAPFCISPLALQKDPGSEKGAFPNRRGNGERDQGKGEREQ